MACQNRWAPARVRRDECVPTWESLVPKDAQVRLFDEIFSEIDWSPFEAEYKNSGLGQPPIHPRYLAAAILYGLYLGIRSSRKLENACFYRFDMMWLLECRRPDHTTLSKFRTRFHAPLKELFRQVGRLALGLGVVRLGTVAFDGTRVKANNRRYGTGTAKTLEEKLRALDALFEHRAAECQAADEKEADQGSATQLPKTLADLEQRRERLRNALQKARVDDELRRKQGTDPEKRPAQVPLTDPDSRVMSNKEGGYAPNYTPTAVTDGQQGFILDCDVLSEINETSALAESVDRVEETFGQKPKSMLTDAGNNSGQNIEDMEQRGVKFYAPVDSHEPQEGNPARRDDPTQPIPESEWSKLPRNNQGQLDKSCFVYDAQNDEYRCPQGHAMPYAIWKSEKRQGVRVVLRVHRCEACRGCPLAAACLSKSAKHGRTITRDQYEAQRQRLAKRMAEPSSRELYGRRLHMAESTFGILKSVFGLRQFLLRGLEKVKTEWRWAATAFNIIKLVRAIRRLRADRERLAIATGN